MSIENINRFGEVEVSFNETLIMPANWTHINSTVLDISVNPFNDDMQALKDLEWEILSFGGTMMTLKVEFQYPSSISDDVEGKDLIVIKVINPIFFYSETSFTTVKNETTIFVDHN